MSHVTELATGQLTVTDQVIDGEEFNPWRGSRHSACGEDFLSFLERHNISETSVRRRGRHAVKKKTTKGRRRRSGRSGGASDVAGAFKWMLVMVVVLLALLWFGVTLSAGDSGSPDL